MCAEGREPRWGHRHDGLRRGGLGRHCIWKGCNPTTMAKRSGARRGNRSPFQSLRRENHHTASETMKTTVNLELPIDHEKRMRRALLSLDGLSVGDGFGETFF